MGRTRGGRTVATIGTCGSALAAGFLFLFSSGGRSILDPNATNAGIVLAEKTFGGVGGRLSIDDPASPLRGFAIDVPAGALDGAETIRVSWEPELPAPLPEAVAAASPVVHLTKDSPASFRQPVTVTVPLADEACDREPAAVYFETALGRYEPVTVTAVDRARRTLTFRTVHFTPFLAVATKLWHGAGAKIERGVDAFREVIRTEVSDVVAPNLSGPLAPVDTGFRPNPDGFQFKNLGDYTAGNSGNCLGMSLVAIQWYEDERTKGRGAVSLQTRFPGNSPEGQIATGEAEARARASFLSDVEAPLSDPATGDRLYHALAATGSPQILSMSANTINGGHDVVVFGYANGAFQIYDPNFPGETLTWDFSPETGFGTYRFPDGAPVVSKFPSPYGEFTLAGTGSASDYFSHADLDRIIETGAHDPRYRDVKVTQVEPSDAGVEVQGAVTGGLEGAQPVTWVQVWAGDHFVAQAPIPSSNDFSVTVTRGELKDAGLDPATPHAITLEAITGDAAFAGGTTTTLPPATPAPEDAPSPGIVGALGASSRE
jgi:hypothetical protein